MSLLSLYTLVLAKAVDMNSSSPCTGCTQSVSIYKMYLFISRKKLRKVIKRYKSHDLYDPTSFSS